MPRLPMGVILDDKVAGVFHRALEKHVKDFPEESRKEKQEELWREAFKRWAWNYSMDGTWKQESMLTEQDVKDFARLGVVEIDFLTVATVFRRIALPTSRKRPEYIYVPSINFPRPKNPQFPSLPVGKEVPRDAPGVDGNPSLVSLH